MLSRLNKRSKGQSTAEYAILIGLVIAAAVAMQIYVKRGLQARAHDATLYLVNKTGNIETPDSASAKFQYEPYYINSSFTVTRNTESDLDLRSGNYSSYEYANTQRAVDGFQKYESVVNE